MTHARASQPPPPPIPRVIGLDAGAGGEGRADPSSSGLTGLHAHLLELKSVIYRIERAYTALTGLLLVTTVTYCTHPAHGEGTSTLASRFLQTFENRVFFLYSPDQNFSNKDLEFHRNLRVFD